MPPVRPQIYWSLQAGRGIAAILIVVYHTAAMMGTDQPYWRIPLLHQRFTGFALGVQFFFVLSGAVILLAHFDDIGHPAALPAYLWKRFRRVYPIYWFVLTFILVSYAWRPELRASPKAGFLVIVSNYLLIHLGTLEVNLNVAWTLFHETLFYAVFCLFLVRRNLGLFVLGLWCSLCVLMVFLHGPVGLREYLIAPVNVLFAFGMLAAWLLRTRAIARAGIIAALGTAVITAAIVVACLRFDLGNPVQYLAGIGAALLILGTARLEELGRLTIPHALRFFGDASYSIYLIHFPFLTLITPFVYRTWLRQPVPPILPFVFLPILAIAAGCAMRIWIERPLLKLLSRHKPGWAQMTKEGRHA